MQFSLNLLGWCAHAPGLSETAQWQRWAISGEGIKENAPYAKLNKLPAMTARRLASGSKLAIECGLEMVEQFQPQAIVYSSRHGELEKNYRILTALAESRDVSPIDFALSVHNAAVGNLSITARLPVPTTSISAGIDTFQQALFEVYVLLKAGHHSVLLVDFDGNLPDFYHDYLPTDMPKWAYASAFVFTLGEQLNCSFMSQKNIFESDLPQSLIFLKNYLTHSKRFVIAGERGIWEWSYHGCVD